MKKMITLEILIIATISYSYSMHTSCPPCDSSYQREKELSLLKDERRKKEEEYRNLLKLFLNKCPKDGNYHWWQRTFFTSQIRECQDLSNQLDKFKEKLRSDDIKIKQLKKSIKT